MDEETKRMLEDLGLHRREAVSAPNADSRGFELRDDITHQKAVKREAEARKELLNANGSSQGNGENHNRLRAWNSMAIPATDENASGLENRYSGQGHRAALAQSLHRGEDPWDDVDSRVGEERRIYLQKKGRGPQDYFHASASLKGSLLGRPRVPAKGTRNTTSQPIAIRGRIVQRPMNPQRAPSPRAFGTVRFGPDGTRTTLPNTTSSSTARTEAGGGGKGLSSSIHSSTVQPSLPSTTTPNMSKRTATARQNDTADVATTSATTQGASTLNATAKPNTSVHAAESTAKAPNASILGTTTNQNGAVRVTPTSATAPNGTTRNAGHSKVTSVQPKAQARSAPDELLRQRLNEIKTLHWAANPGKECDEYYTEHPDELQDCTAARTSLIKESVQLVCQNDATKSERYIQQHRDRGWMIEAASKAKSLIETGAVASQIDAYLSAHSLRQLFWDTVKSTLEISGKLPTETRTESQNHEYKPIVASGPSIKSSHHNNRQTTTTNSVHGNKTYFSLTESFHDTSNSEPTKSNRASHFHNPGTLTATFYDSNSELQGTHQDQLAVPVNILMSVQSRSKHYDPRDLVAGIEELAAEMRKRTQRSWNSTSDKGRVVGTARAGEGDLWAEDSD